MASWSATETGSYPNALSLHEMTHSNEKRQQNCKDALERMLRVLGDDAVGETVFNPEDKEFENIIPTTWTDLCDEKWVEKAEVPRQYRLTGIGWLQALRITGQISEKKFRKRLSGTCRFD